MMKNMVFEGCCTALVTPFDEKGQVNYFKLKELIEFQIASGVNAILILGTTGESPCISSEERTKIIKFCKSEISGRIPLIVGCGSNSTEIAKAHLIEAYQLGADAGLVVTPYYNKCSQKGLILHYKELAKTTKLPLIMYNVPSRTGVNILPETAYKLSKIKNIVGIKEASGNMSQLAKICSLVQSDFAVYCGDDSMTLPAMSLGAKGVVSVTSNIEPEKVSLMCNLAQKHDFFNARRIHNSLYKLSEALFFDVNPICIKAYMNLCGFEVGGVRLPLSSTNKKVLNKLIKLKREYEEN